MNKDIEAYMLKCMEDAAHDKLHVYRVLNAALRIASAHPEVDMEILEAACLLHDVGRAKQAADPSVCHARAGAEMAREFLVSRGWSAERAERVADCVRTHRFRSDDPPTTIEARILFDADKLEAAGLIGIARTLIYGGQIGRPLYARGSDGKIAEFAGDGTFFHEYHYKLEHIYNRFYTAEGREMAEARRDAASAFIAELKREIDGD